MGQDGASRSLKLLRQNSWNSYHHYGHVHPYDPYMLPLSRFPPRSSVPSADCPQSVSFMELSLSLKVSKMLLLQLLVVLFPFPSIQLVSSTHEGLLYPISSETRETISLDGIWKIRVANEFDPHEGFRDSWYSRSIDQVTYALNLFRQAE